METYSWNGRSRSLIAMVIMVVWGMLIADPVRAVPTDFLRGDANDDGVITLSDVMYVTQYLFGGGPVPVPLVDSADANCDGRVSPMDAVYLVNYTLRGGPQPKCPL